MRSTAAKHWVCAALFALMHYSPCAQQYFTRTGYIGFFSSTPLENIEAENHQVLAIIDTEKKELAFTCLMKGFLFKKQLMQQHFNENYVESDQYPKASFNGTYTLSSTNGNTQQVMVSGALTLHGVTRQLNVAATLTTEGNKLLGKAAFQLAPADFNIKIPALVRDKIAKKIDVKVLALCEPK